jgi:hypothetical protein
MKNAFNSMCCSRSLVFDYDANYKPTCSTSAGERLVMTGTRQGNLDRPLLARSCDDQHCPPNAACRQGTRFAYCCQLAGRPIAPPGREINGAVDFPKSSGASQDSSAH